MNIGRSVRVACALKDITRRDLAKMAGVSEMTVSNIVRGRGPCSSHTIEALAGACGMKVSIFVALGED